MADFNSTNPVAVGYTAKASQYKRVFDNTLALYEGKMALPSQAAGDAMYFSSATQIARVAHAYGILKFSGSGTVTIGPASNLRCDQEAAGRCVLPIGADKWAT